MEASMAFLSFIYKHGIWISIPAFVLSLILLILSIIGVVQTGRDARLFSVPLVERQEIEFTETGKVVLCMEGPILSRRFVKLEYEITGPDGVVVKRRPLLFRASTTGFTKARMELETFKVTHPGRHVFQIRGLEGGKPSDAQHQMVFTRTNLARIMMYVVGIIIGGIFTIGSMVLFFLRLLNISTS
jgi:hypothetical protein